MSNRIIISSLLQQSLRESKTSAESITVLFTSRELLKLMTAATIAYTLSAMIFDGLVRLSEHLGLDFFLIFTLSSATEIPALLSLAVTLDRYEFCMVRWLMHSFQHFSYKINFGYAVLIGQTSIKIFYLVFRWGRRALTCGPIMIVGILNILAAFLPQGNFCLYEVNNIGV